VVTIIDEFEYLHNGKLKKHIQKVNNNPKELIVANTYDELGQLISKQVGGQDIQNEIGYQKIDYRYNIRGWLTHINDIDDLSDPNAQMGDLFAFKINYNEITEVDNGDMNFVATSFNNTVKPLFNGNIAETYWKSRTDNILRKYSYSYDNLNRLKKAYFQKPYDVVSHTQSFDEYIDYDKNGNIFRLQRFADQNEYGNVIEIDALGYHYQQHSNKLMKVTDVTNFSAGFGDDSDGTNDTDDDYAYDDNGNMISDQNKGIGRIRYNHLNLPTEIRFDNGGIITYLYTASGVKVGKTVHTGGSTPVQTDYLDGFQYVNDNLQFFPHPEGYVSVVKFGTETLVINYAYQYKDHLGNIRLNYGKDPETNVLKVLEENHYYPFGLKHQNYNTGRRQLGKKEEILAGNLTLMPAFVLPTEEKPMVYKYKYNGKEWQDELGLNVYDFHARNYMPDIGRTSTQDPHAENYYNLSSYSFLNNNPLLFVDPDGKDFIVSYTDKEGKNQEYRFNGQSAGVDGRFHENDYVNDFITSYNYNVGNGGGQSMKAIATNSDATVYVEYGEFNYQDNGSPGDNSANVITWNNKAGLETTNGYTLSPATLLDHESAHALNGLNNKVEKSNKHGAKDNQYDNKEEARVITGPEQVTARANGEVPFVGITRNDHNGRYVITKSATSNIVNIPQTKQWIQSYNNRGFYPRGKYKTKY
jgi:RHS repeat-associated protein